MMSKKIKIKIGDLISALVFIEDKKDRLLKEHDEGLKMLDEIQLNTHNFKKELNVYKQNGKPNFSNEMVDFLKILKAEQEMIELDNILMKYKNYLETLSCFKLINQLADNVWKEEIDSANNVKIFFDLMKKEIVVQEEVVVEALEYQNIIE